jgi:hypothetical protein
MKGMCKLCLTQNADLRESHFTPRSLYALVRSENHPPVRFTRKSIYPTVVQTKHPLFCGVCEQLLSREGENWLVPLLSKLGGSFPLRDRLMKVAPIYRDANMALYPTAENPEIDYQKLMHFAIGIFYKAAVHSWVKDCTKPHIEIDDEDIESMRLFLLGEAPLSTRIAVCLAVDSSQVVLPAVIEPYYLEDADFTRYAFYVPGVLAHLVIGEGAQDRMSVNCINADPRRPILLEELSKRMRNNTRVQTANARKTKKLIETTEELDAKGLSIRLGE